jgi:hypothetical protein
VRCATAAPVNLRWLVARRRIVASPRIQGKRVLNPAAANKCQFGNHTRSLRFYGPYGGPTRKRSVGNVELRASRAFRTHTFGTGVRHDQGNSRDASGRARSPRRAISIACCPACFAHACRTGQSPRSAVGNVSSRAPSKQRKFHRVAGMAGPRRLDQLPNNMIETAFWIRSSLEPPQCLGCNGIGSGHIANKVRT